MNKLEAFVYKKVKNNYKLKNFVRNVYQGFYDLLPNYDSQFSYEPIVLSNSFYGFHDTKPFSDDGSMLLACRCSIPLRMPTAEDFLEVGFWCGEGFKDWKKVGETLSWNYHKGCRLQWVAESNECIYNVFANGKLRSCVNNVVEGSNRLIDWPIDTVSVDGRIATSFSYERLQQMMPGYGYVFGDDDAFLEEDIPNKTGLFLIDLKKNTRELFLSLKDIAAFKQERSMIGTFHFVTHTEFSPDGRYVSFLHRWYRGTSRNTRLLVYDMEQKQLFASPTSGMVSHYAWNKIGGIVAYCRVENVDSHVYFESAEMNKWKRCGYPKLNSDGHQHFIDNDWFLTDTYPDKWRHCKLYKVNRKTDEVILLADVKSPKRFVSPDEQHHWKCDLHPRCDAQGRWASFDSVHTGERSLCVMPLNSIGSE